jgi:hypothetical protein
VFSAYCLPQLAAYRKQQAPCTRPLVPGTWYHCYKVCTWCILCTGTKYLVPSAWYHVLGTEYLVPSTWYQVFGTKYLVPSTWYQVLGTKYLVPGTWYQVPCTWYEVPGPSTGYQVLDPWSRTQVPGSGSLPQGKCLPRGKLQRKMLAARLTADRSP